MAKTLHYDFLTNPTLTGSEHPVATSPTLSITRATKATMVADDGYIHEVPSGIARFTGATFNQNLFLYSEDFDNAAWLDLGGPTITANAAEAPDGTTTAASISGPNALWYFYQNNSVSEYYTVEFWVKRNTTSDQSFQLFMGSSSSGTLTATDTWQQFSFSAVGATGNAGIRSILSGDKTAELLIWHPSLNRGAPTATYLTTTDSARTEFTGTSTKGLLVEEARTNLAFPSEALDDARWTAGIFGATVNADATTSPDGSITADEIEGSGGGTGIAGIRDAYSFATSTAYIFSVFAKADQSTWMFLDVTGMATQQITGYFNLGAGAVGTTGTDVTSSGIEDYGNGWYRCWLGFTTDSSDTVAELRIQLADSDGDNSVALDNTSSIFVWGAQLEAGAFPTSYIATTTASVTRNADAVNTTNMGWHTADSGTWYWNGQSSAWQVSATPRCFELTAAAGVRITDIFDNGSGTPRFFSAYNGSIIADAGDFVTDVSSRVVVTDAVNDIVLYVDGVNEGSDTATVATGTPVGLALGARYNVGTHTDFLNGHIAEIAYFNERLANATLEDYSLNGLPTAFPGTIAGDGGHIWPARSNDPRWAQIITDSGITPSGNFIDDVHQALEAMASDTGAMDDLWKKVKAIYSITDTSEPFTY